MNSEQLNEILMALREHMKSCASIEEFDRMLEARDALQQWASEGFPGEIPFAKELRGWNIELPTGYESPAPASSASSASYDALPATPRHDEPQIDYDLQVRYEDALADLREGHYYQARNALRELQQEASGPLVQLIQNAYQEASQKLQAQTRRLVNQARRIQRDSRDPREQTDAWKAVQRVNPESREANQALAALAREQVEHEIASQLSSMRKRAKLAARGDQLPELNNLLGQVQIWKALGEKTPPEISDSLYQQVVELEREVRRLRLETRLGLIKWVELLACSDYREAYRYGRDLFERAVPTLVDVVGIFGPKGSEIDTAEFFKKARELFINQLQSLAGQRLAQLEGEEKQSLEKALETLKDAESRLTDKVLTTDARAELKPFLDKVLERQQDIQRRIEKYNKAKQKIIQAQRATTRVEALALYQEAKYEYPDYPNLDTLIERAQGDVAKVVASEVAAAITLARRQMQRERYELALQTLAKAHTEAMGQVTNPKPNSGLAKRLADVATLEKEIAEAEHDHEKMMALLGRVDEAIEYFDNGVEQALRSAHNLLGLFSEAQRHHHEVRKQLAAVAVRQSEMDNWGLGQDEYRQGNWVKAEEILRQVAKGETHYAAEAANLADRALAGQYVERAQQAEQRFEWEDALFNYQQAVNLLDKVGPDVLTEPVLLQAQVALQRLPALQERDEQVRELISQATSLYQTARRRAEVRRSLRQRVEPIGEFASAVRLLQEASEKGSTMAEQVNNLLREVQGYWRGSYLGSIKAALTSPQVEIVQKALVLAQELHDANLIYDIDKEELREAKFIYDIHEGQLRHANSISHIHEKELVRHLMLKVLDNEYEQLMRQIPTPWAQMESNRQERLSIDTTPEVEAAYRKALHGRIFRYVYELKLLRGPAAAKYYLLKTLQNPFLRAEHNLVAILIELCWEVEDWQEAERWAVDLAYQEQAVGEVWNGLTRAVRSFKAAQIEPGRAELGQMRQRQKKNRELISLINKKEPLFLRESLERLIGEAQHALTQGTEEGYLEAVLKFSQAAQLEPNDSRILAGLKQMNQPLSAIIRQCCTDAKKITIGQRPLENAIQELDRLHSILHAIYQAADNLPLDSAIWWELKHTLEEVTPKYERWKEVQNLLNQAHLTLEHTLQRPHTLSTVYDDASASGWDFDRVIRYLRDARKRSRTDRECQRIVRQVEDGVRRMEEQAFELHNSIQNFMHALRHEEFDHVLDQINQLTVLWRRACQQAPWAGLEQLIHYHYPWYGREVEELAEHKRLTIERKINLAQWQEWSGAAESCYREVRKRGRILIIEGLDDLRYDYALAELLQLCREHVKLCNKLDELIYTMPEREPLSQKAEAARDRIERKAWENEIIHYRAKVMILQKEAEQELERLMKPDGPLQRLKQMIKTQITPFERRNRPVPLENISRAKHMLEQCEKIDPNHKQVKEYRERLNKLKQMPRQKSWWESWLGG